MVKKSRKSGGTTEENLMELSTIEGTEDFDLDNSLHLSDLELEEEDTMNQTQNTTAETINVPPLENEPESQGSLHLSDLDTSINTSVNTTQESIGGKKRKTTKKRSTKKKNSSTKKNKKNSTNKKKNKKKKTISKKNKKGGQENTLQQSIQQSEKQILPKDENPAF